MADKIVYRGIKQVIEPLIDHEFKPWSFGFRKRMNRSDAIAKATSISERHQKWTWVRADIQDAFDSIPLEPLVEILSKYVPCSPVLDLVRRCIKIGKNEVGLEQGSPLSPLLMNLFLHHEVDRVWGKESDEQLLIRYADDFLLMCKSEKSAKEGLQILTDLLAKAGLNLKPVDQAIVRLPCQETAAMLGFGVTQKDDGLVIEIAESSLLRFKDSLMELGDRQLDAVAAYNKLLGWFKEQGAAYSPSYAKRVVKDVLKCLKQVGLSDRSIELGAGESMRICDAKFWVAQWKASHNAWISRHSRPVKPMD